MWADILSSIGKIIEPLLSAIKWMSAIFFAQKNARSESENKILENQNEVKTKQLEIAARPRARWRDLLDRMRRNDL